MIPLTCEEKREQLLTIYRKVSLLSQKNGCSVWRIRHRELERDLVLHELPSPNAVYEELCSVRSPHLPAVYDVFSLDDGMIVLEEYIDGLTVAQVAETGRYRPAGAKQIIHAVCDGLTVLHNRNIVHRDIKPENIMVDANGRVVLIDFNAARKVSLKSRDTVVMGTLGYASPEQLGISQTDARADIYAAGILLNVLLTGKHPSDELARGHMGRVVRKCTDIDPTRRYQTAQKLADSL